MGVFHVHGTSSIFMEIFHVHGTFFMFMENMIIKIEIADCGQRMFKYICCSSLAIFYCILAFSRTVDILVLFKKKKPIMISNYSLLCQKSLHQKNNLLNHSPYISFAFPFFFDNVFTFF